MPSWDDVRRIALALPESSEGSSRGLASWRVREKGFVWERPLRPADIRALGDEAPTGAILGELNELIVEAWLCRAPKRIAQHYIDTQLNQPPGGSASATP